MYADLAMYNEESKKRIGENIKQAEKLKEIIDSKDKEEFVKYFREAADFYKDFREEALGDSSFLIEQLSRREGNGKVLKVPEKKEIMEGVGIADFSDWEKLDLRVAEIKKVEEIEGADKLWKLTIDVGDLGERIICAGIKEYYSKEELKGKKIIIVFNLEPRKMRGVESQGMLLAASTEEHEEISLLTIDREMKNGVKIS